MNVPRAHGSSILIVDDDEDVRALLAHHLSGQGHTCVCAADGDQARAAFAEHSFDLALCDVSLPRESGIELAQRLLTEHPETAVVMISGIDDPAIAEVALERGAYGYIVKPFTKNQVLISVANALLRRQLEIDGRARQEELEQFAYYASHDLLAPLRTLKMLIVALEARVRAKTDPEARDLFAKIGRRTDGMQTLIEDLFSYSRSIRSDEVPRLVQTSEALAEALDALKATIEHTGARIDVGDLPEAVAVFGDLVLVFQNLIGNSLKFHAPGAAPNVRISAEERDGMWVFSVLDDGIGVDAKFTDRIFEPFRRAHSSDRFPGSGLGLAICHKIIDRNQGRIWVESPAAGGANFRFTLRAAEHGEANT